MFSRLGPRLLTAQVQVRPLKSWRRLGIRTVDSFQRSCLSNGSDREDLPDNKISRKVPKYKTSTKWLDQIQSPPNLITMGRIAGTPILSYWIITGNHEYALIGCTLAGLSDGLDGYLAKNFDMKTRLGTYLDPIADKLLVGTLSVTLWMTEILPTPLVVLWLAKDAGLLAGTAYIVFCKDQEQSMEVQPTRTAKFSTFLQFATIGTGILLPIYPTLEGTLTSLCYMTGASTVASGLSYVDMHAFHRTTASTSSDPKD